MSEYSQKENKVHSKGISDCVLGHLVVSNSLQTHGPQPARLFCPWDFPGNNTGMGCQFLLQGIFPIQGLNPSLSSPALTNEFLDTAPPGNPRINISLFLQKSIFYWNSFFFFLTILKPGLIALISDTTPPLIPLCPSPFQRHKFTPVFQNFLIYIYLF